MGTPATPRPVVVEAKFTVAHVEYLARHLCGAESCTLTTDIECGGCGHRTNYWVAVDAPGANADHLQRLLDHIRPVGCRVVVLGSSLGRKWVVRCSACQVRHESRAALLRNAGVLAAGILLTCLSLMVAGEL